MSDAPLYEDFSGPDISRRLRWQSEPALWHVDSVAARLVLEPDAGTDFWQWTHYGYEGDNGHFLGLEAAGDFVLTTRVTSCPVHQYDQAGLMVRVSPACWLKTSVEYEPVGPSHLGAVVTNAQSSDWSMRPLPKGLTDVWFRVRAEACDYVVEWSASGSQWELLRIARLHERRAAPSVLCGIYACSPKDSGFRAEFSSLNFEPGRLT